MTRQVVINSLTGSTDFNIWIGENCEDTSPTFLGTVSSSELPYSFNIPTSYINSTMFCIIVYDSNNCVYCDCKYYS
jgi:hypothetical protein